MQNQISRRPLLIALAASFMTSLLFSSATYAQSSEALEVRKIWLWKNEVQIQLQTADSQSGYILNLVSYNGRLLSLQSHSFGPCELILSQAIEVKQQILESLQTAEEAEILLFASKEEIFGVNHNYLQRLSEMQTDPKRVILKKTKLLLQKLLSGRIPDLI